ncbi:PorP/SprF family type IX secretion system membrane protein [Kriegella aquimaris]|uniref:Type IX secretion system membrane protein, PorP/SprF family n=1 Tax=Kriegella aquimaris TaxID=192904 RepID=A0A1G9QFU3_9FLAO|nr:type IX secretion system membrane protein PorP/SprF [Kriegella aquimaris]SDM09367.1 type IX secretion system membrane protein, PorP/SprF family [Kriegella aquimaris]
MKLTKIISLFVLALLALTKVSAQEDDPILPYKVAPQNLLKFNRFLINPTFSTVREDKSYINLLHRNQSVQFQDNDQTYFLSYSGRIGDRSGLGLSLYTQKIGPVSNIGVLANYAYGIKLSDKSNFTFGGNLAYYSTGLDINSIDVVDTNDFRLNGTEDSNVLSFQPGFNISFGKFDFGAFAENLLDYNIKTSKSLTEFKDKAYSGHLQYTHQFENTDGIMESGRLMPLARARMDGQNDLTLGGSLILDLPKLGWLQGGYDSFYGASVGAGFNINRRLSLGYTMEKGLSTDFDNLGVTHEISFAYSFTPMLTEDRVMLEDDLLVENDEEAATNKDEQIEELKKKLAENDAIIAELMFRQDSLESNRKTDLERRFEMVMKMVRNETKSNRPDLEQKAEQLFLNGQDKPSSKTNNASNDGVVLGNSTQRNQPQDVVVTTNKKREKLAIKHPEISSSSQSSKNAVKSRKFKNLEGVEDGYYVVANVYKGGRYMDKFMNNLEQKGIQANYIDNPNNGLKYVYLQRFDTWQEAVDAHKSKLNGKYDEAMWIMNVDNRYSNEAYVQNVDKLREKSIQYGTDVLRQNVIVRDNLASAEAASKTVVTNGIGSGYYIIANVFANPSNAKKFIKLLNSYGLSASYFINPENNYRYVYLKKHDSWNNALISYYSKLNDAYNDKMWIMRVTPDNIT